MHPFSVKIWGCLQFSVPIAPTPVPKEAVHQSEGQSLGFHRLSESRDKSSRTSTSSPPVPHLSYVVILH